MAVGTPLRLEMKPVEMLRACERKRAWSGVHSTHWNLSWHGDSEMLACDRADSP